MILDCLWRRREGLFQSDLNFFNVLKHTYGIEYILKFSFILQTTDKFKITLYKIKTNLSYYIQNE